MIYTKQLFNTIPSRLPGTFLMKYFNKLFLAEAIFFIENTSLQYFREKIGSFF
jgi:hypothetical protein